VLSLQPRGWVKASVLHDAASCTGCRHCRTVCPFDAIAMVEGPDAVGSQIPALEEL
jgi:Fe-S-cluster-containing hydrogenase component 2